MTDSTEWPRLLELLSVPPEPAILVAAPDSDGLLQAIADLRPSARLSILDLTPDPRPAPPALAARRIPLITADALDLGDDTFDLAVFDHAIDDIVVEAIARHEGIPPDSREDQGEYAPRPRAVRAYWRSGDLESVAAPALLEIVRSCSRALRPSARIVFHHRVIDADLLAGHPLDLYAEYLSLARRWIADAHLDLREVSLDSYDPSWWMCLQRAA